MTAKRRNVRVAIAGLAGLVVLAGVGSIAARQIRSPAQIAADTAAPAASRITAPVERRALATEVIVRGTVRYGTPQEVVLPASGLKTSTQVISRVPKPGARLGDGDTALVVSGRPVFTLNGATPMHRDLGPGMKGEDVFQLEVALARAGFGPGGVDGRYDRATAGAVAAFYDDHGQAPFGPTDAQATDLSSAAATAAAARDAVLQMRLALKTAAVGTTPGDVSQARLDAVAAAELIPPARAAIATARDHEAGAQAAIDGAKLSEAEARINADRDIGLADADVITKGAAVTDAVEAQAEAQRQLAAAPPDMPSNERATLEAAVRHAVEAIGVARGDLTAAQRSAASARSGVGVAVARARSDGRRAGADLRLARAETRSARASLGIAARKHALARTRISVLERPPDTALERELVTSARAEADRTRMELAQLAGRIGVQVPADEVLFFPTLPLRVDSLAARRGTQLNGSVMTVTNSRLAIDSSLSVGDAKLVRRGMRVAIEEQDLRVKIQGRVSRVADKPGTTPSDWPARRRQTRRARTSRWCPGARRPRWSAPRSSWGSPSRARRARSSPCRSERSRWLPTAALGSSSRPRGGRASSRCGRAGGTGVRRGDSRAEERAEGGRPRRGRLRPLGCAPRRRPGPAQIPPRPAAEALPRPTRGPAPRPRPPRPRPPRRATPPRAPRALRSPAPPRRRRAPPPRRDPVATPARPAPAAAGARSDQWPLRSRPWSSCAPSAAPTARTRRCRRSAGRPRGRARRRDRDRRPVRLGKRRC